MTFDQSVTEQIEDELSRGEMARQEGYEGRARVCARRAVGIAVRAYLTGTGQSQAGLISAYELIDALRRLPGMDAEICNVANHLLARVNEAFALPVEVDLLAEARWLIVRLAALTGGENQTQRRETDE